MLKEIFTFSNCIQYLENMSFTDITFKFENGGNLYFSAYCQDDEVIKEIEFEPNYTNNNITVSTRLSVNDPFVILEIVED